ncbi:gene transfer agent family protein [Sulfitobacter aestuariivivens]|uniref:Gene transfer agent family protein n=1 Tax=Sulfitobacter aestuariivivens TaxID=2766981 RepID=A0A927HE24_9RHOB|nr:gene transfer agent family protein [Sulfitobacter aestuariivivens]MBD3662933.1 gene transfer agent family protein [Sulfitobacter aestuariivivens]
MANPWRGDVAVVIDGERLAARLTLGALAELEEDLGESSLLALVERFESNRFSTRDVLALLNAGLRGGGHVIDPERLQSGDFEGGPMAAAKAAAELLARAFVVPS